MGASVKEMSSRQRFHEAMRYGAPDRPPYFQEGIRPKVLEAWRAQGFSEAADIVDRFPSDRREELSPDLDPVPKFPKWPASRTELGELEKRLDPSDPGRLPEDWQEHLRAGRDRRHVAMLRVHRGFFLSMGVHDWDRFMELMDLVVDDPGFVKDYMAVYGRFAAAVADGILKEASADAVVFSEPIGGNTGPLISPEMYEELVLESYRPLLEVVRRYEVPWIVFRTYANARLLVPSILRRGFNCLWACEVDAEAMDYRSLRREFGRDLRLVGGIDLDALRRGRDAIRREVLERVPVLLEQGGYVPLADGRVREDVPFEHYVYYRQLLQRVMEGKGTS